MTSTATSARPARTASDRMPAGSVRVLALLLLATFVMILNETIMSVALSPLMADLHIDAATAQWLSTAFMLTMAIVIPVTGVIQQRFSTRQVFTVSTSLFFLGTLLAAVAPGFSVVLAGRVIQAMGTALMVPLLMTTVMVFVPPARRGSVMGLASVVISAAPAIGPTVSGVILNALSWRWLFGVMAPIAAIALIAGIILVRNVGERQPASVDVLSIVLSALGFGFLIFGLASIGQDSESSGGVPPWGYISIGVVALAFFVWRQAVLGRTDRALLDLRPFRRPSFSLGLIIMLVAMAALFGTVILLPIYLQNVHGYSALNAGLALLPGGVLQAVISPFTGRFYDRIGAKPLVIPGTAIITAAMWLFSTLDRSSQLWEIVGIHMLLSVGLGVLLTPLITAALGDVPRAHYSHGSAILNTVQQLASAAGTAVFVTIMTAGTASSAASGNGSVDAQQYGIHLAFLIGSCVGAVAVLLSLLLPTRKQPQDDEAETEAGS